MRRTHPILTSALALAVAVATATGAAAAPAPRDTMSTTTRASLLLRWATDAVNENTVESRQRALLMLDRVLRDDPRNAAAWREKGRANEIGRLDREARLCYAQACAVEPGEPDNFMRLGMAWRHEWLRVLGAEALDSAVVMFERVVALRPNAYEARMRLVPLYVEAGRPADAMRAAERAAEVRPRRGEPALAVAYLAWRRGEVERADSLVRWAYDRVPRDVRRKLEDMTPLLGPVTSARLDSLGPAKESAELQRIWDRMDPDPTTPQTEVRLEYGARVIHAWLLFDDPMRPIPDARADAYVRYGAPRGVAINPPGMQLFTRHQNPGLKEAIARSRPFTGSVPQAQEYPMDVMVLPYPDLGMRVVLQDRSLLGRYEPPLLRDDDPASRPDPKRLKGRDDLLALEGGLAVFPTLPPREQRVEVRGTLARFESGAGPRLFAQVNAPASPGDTLWARWMVRDSSGRVRVRQEDRFATSVCDPAGRRIAEINAALPPGDYDVVVSVRDSHHKRGLWRVPAELAAPPDSLALSDAVLTCGDPTLLVEGRSIRLEADREARVSAGSPVVVYFEIYRLAAGEDGMSRFEYEYTVRRLRETADGDLTPEKAAALTSSSASRVETQAGAMRRQFVSVPAQALTPGRYRLEVRVRDLVNGRVARREVAFVKE
jgi:Flp pilus assembly protein TadD